MLNRIIKYVTLAVAASTAAAVVVVTLSDFDAGRRALRALTLLPVVAILFSPVE